MPVSTKTSDWEKCKDVLKDVYVERQAQEDKWGRQDHAAPMWYSILGEEVGEVARGFLDHDMPNYRDELVQVAAVAVAAVEAYDRGTTEAR